MSRTAFDVHARVRRRLLAVTAGVVLALGGAAVGVAARAAGSGSGSGGLGVGGVASPAYWLLTDNGGIMSFGGTQLFGSATNLGAPVVGMAPSADGLGYWIVAANGQVAAQGDAPALGSIPWVTADNPIVAVAATPDGKGYWLASARGGVLTYGDAQFYGSLGGVPLNRPIVGMSASPDGRGYRLVASDGGIFTFGDAAFHGSTGAMRLNQPIVGMAATPDNGGYWLVAADGGVFTFGDAPFDGSAGAIHLDSPVVGMSRTPDGGGYWLSAADGGVFTYGNAPFRGSVGGIQLLHAVIAMASGPGSGSGVGISANEGLGPYPSGSVGYDISWPQCGNGYPGAEHAVGIVGVNDGHAFSTNPCLADEVRWAGPAHGLYMNLNSPSGSSNSAGGSGPAGNCAPSDTYCWSYNYGYAAALASVRTAAGQGAMAQQWWLDVETGNYWTGDTGANARVIQGATDALHSQGLTVGVYSTPYQWGEITGGARFGIPVWVATGIAMSDPGSWCVPAHSFNGGNVWMVQFGLDGFDGDYAC